MTSYLGTKGLSIRINKVCYLYPELNHDELDYFKVVVDDRMVEETDPRDDQYMDIDIEIFPLPSKYHLLKGLLWRLGLSNQRSWSKMSHPHKILLYVFRFAVIYQSNLAFLVGNLL